MKIILFSQILILVLFPCFLKAQTSDNSVLNYSTSCIIENGKNVIEVSYLIQVNNKAGDWITDVEIPFQKSNKVKFVDGEIRDNLGRVIRKLKKSEIIETSHISNISLYDDNLVKTFSLKHNQYPYQIFFKYAIEYKEFFWIESWTPVLHQNTPTKFASLTIQAPQDYLVKINQQNIQDYEVDTLNGMISYHWESSYLNIIKDEIYAPNIKELFPYVHIVPVNFLYGVAGSHKTWESYGNWVERLSEGLNVLPVSEQGKIHHLIRGVEDPKEIIKLLYNYMQDNTRYINVAIDIGGMKPYPAEYVALNKYGDCKALTNYMKSLLEIAKIPSYCVDVFADNNIGKIYEDFPSQQFNHVVLMVPLENDTIWLENTSNIAPFGYVSSFIQNRKGLVVNGEKSQLINIPGLGEAEVTENRSINYFIDNQVNCKAEIKASFKGPKFEFYNSVSQYAPNEQKKILEKYLPFKNFEISTWQLKKSDRNSAEVFLHSNLILKNLISNYDNDLIIKPEPLQVPDFQIPEGRQLPVRISYPIYRVDSMTFSFPEDMVLKKHSEAYHTKSPFGSYTVSIESGVQEVKIIRKFVLNSGDYSISRYPEFYNFIKTVNLAETKNFINLMLVKN